MENKRIKEFIDATEEQKKQKLALKVKTATFLATVGFGAGVLAFSNNPYAVSAEVSDYITADNTDEEEDMEEYTIPERTEEEKAELIHAVEEILAEASAKVEKNDEIKELKEEKKTRKKAKAEVKEEAKVEKPVKEKAKKKTKAKEKDSVQEVEKEVITAAKAPEIPAIEEQPVVEEAQPEEINYDANEMVSDEVPNYDYENIENPDDTKEVKQIYVGLEEPGTLPVYEEQEDGTIIEYFVHVYPDHREKIEGTERIITPDDYQKMTGEYTEEKTEDNVENPEELTVITESAEEDIVQSDGLVTEDDLFNFENVNEEENEESKGKVR